MTEIKRKGYLDSFHLKLIAILSMTIDHIGAGLFPYETIGGVHYLRLIGRLAFPIFCFLIVEGFYHTRNVKKYMLRLFLFALVSEGPFDLLFNMTDSIFMMQNVFCTLFLGLVAIYLLDEAKKKWGEGSSATGLAQMGTVMAIALLAHLGHVDYAELGIVYMAIFYLYRGNYILLFVILTVVNALFCGFTDIQMFSVLAVPILSLYNGQRGRSMKYFFYAYYPLHLLAIAIIYYLLYGFMPTSWLML